MYFWKLLLCCLGASSKHLRLQEKLLFYQSFRLSYSEASKASSKLKVSSWKTKDIFYGVIT